MLCLDKWDGIEHVIEKEFVDLSFKLLMHFKQIVNVSCRGGKCCCLCTFEIVSSLLWVMVSVRKLAR